VTTNDLVSLFLATAGVFGAAFCLVLAAASNTPLEVQTRPRLARHRADALAGSPILRWLDGPIRALARFDEPLGTEAYRRWVETRLKFAGDPMGLSVSEFMAMWQLVALLLLGVALGVCYLGDTMAYAGTSAIGAVLFGAVVPHLWLSDAAAERTRAFDRALPYALNIVALCLSSGMDLGGALRRVVDSSADSDRVLREEMSLVLQSIELGVTRREAFEALADRLESDHVRALVAAVRQSDKMGTALEPVIRVQATTIQQRRIQDAEKLAGQAGVKVLLPLMFIMLATMLVLFNSIIIKFMTPGGMGGF